MEKPIEVLGVPAKQSTGFTEYSPVRLRKHLVHRGVTFPAGTRGIVVHKHADGVGYEVEFSHPAEMVVSLATSDLEA